MGAEPCFGQSDSYGFYPWCSQRISDKWLNRGTMAPPLMIKLWAMDAVLRSLWLALVKPSGVDLLYTASKPSADFESRQTVDRILGGAMMVMRWIE